MDSTTHPRKRASSRCFDTIKAFEGICDGDPTTVDLEPYLDPVDIWTIAWGHAIRLNGRLLKGLPDHALAYSVFPGGITLARAEALLAEDVRIVEIYLSATFPNLNQNQFDALVSFVFNIGIGQFENSTLFKLLKAGDFVGAAAQFDRWIYSCGRRLAGLVSRRTAECNLFLTPEAPNV